MKQIDFENLLRYRKLNAKSYLNPAEQEQLLQLHHALAEHYKCLMPYLTKIVLTYRGMLGDVNEGLDGDECENLADIIAILINDHEGNL